MKSFTMTDVGRVRKVNQDYTFKSDDSIGELPNLYMVADGMGGYKAGDFASRFTVETIKREVEQHSYAGRTVKPEEVLVEAVSVANADVIKEASGNIDHKGMGTTIVAATVIDDILCFVNVGDSRLYVINEGIRQLSKDHSLVEEMVRLGGIKPEDAKHHPDKNIITRAIGAAKEVEVDYYEHTLKKDDIILMCSDGLTNMVEDDEIFTIVQGSRDVVESVTNLVKQANINGGKDNIGVVLFKPTLGEVSIC